MFLELFQCHSHTLRIGEPIREPRHGLTSFFHAHVREDALKRTGHLGDILLRLLQLCDKAHRFTRRPFLAKPDKHALGARACIHATHLGYL